MSDLSDGNGVITPRVVLLLILSVSMVSSASILIRLSTSPPLVIVFWRTFLGAVLMASVGLLRSDHLGYDRAVLSRNWRWLVVVGVILCLHFSTWFTSLFLTTVAASVVLVNTSPILTGVLSTMLLGEPLGRRSWAGIVVAVLGSVLLAWGDLVASGLGALTGDILAMLSALFLAAYFIGGRRFASDLPITVYTTIVYLTAACATLVLCLLSGLDVIVTAPTEILIFVCLAVFPTALGHSVNNYLLTLVPAYVVSSAVLGEPVGASLLAVVFLQEVPSAVTVLGFVIILCGVAMVLVDLAARERVSVLPLDDPNRP